MKKAIVLTIFYALLALTVANLIRLVRLPDPAPPEIQPAPELLTEPPTGAHVALRTACTYECYRKCNAGKLGCLGDYETQTACQHERKS